MATYTITTTTNQDTILARFLTKQNAERAAESPPLPPYADIQAMIRGVLVGAVQSWRAQQRDEDRALVGDAYNNATPAVQATVKTTLGL